MSPKNGAGAPAAPPDPRPAGTARRTSRPAPTARGHPAAPPESQSRPRQAGPARGVRPRSRHLPLTSGAARPTRSGHGRACPSRESGGSRTLQCPASSRDPRAPRPPGPPGPSPGLPPSPSAMLAPAPQLSRDRCALALGRAAALARAARQRRHRPRRWEGRARSALSRPLPRCPAFSRVIPLYPELSRSSSPPLGRHRAAAGRQV